MNNMKDFELESSYQIYNLRDTMQGTCREVRAWPESPSTIELHAPRERDIEFYGDLSVLFSVEEARLVAKALMKMADEIEENGNA